jgi:hypothetical protein
MRVRSGVSRHARVRSHSHPRNPRRWIRRTEHSRRGAIPSTRRHPGSGNPGRITNTGLTTRSDSNRCFCAVESRRRPRATASSSPGLADHQRVGRPARARGPRASNWLGSGPQTDTRRTPDTKGDPLEDPGMAESPVFTGDSEGGRYWDRTSDLCRVKAERWPWNDRRIGGILRCISVSRRSSLGLIHGCFGLYDGYLNGHQHLLDGPRRAPLHQVGLLRRSSATTPLSLSE